MKKRRRKRARRGSIDSWILTLVLLSALFDKWKYLTAWINRDFPKVIDVLFFIFLKE